LSHPAVADAGVVGLPDVVAGELPTAMVVRHPNSTEAISEKELMNYVSGTAALVLNVIIGR
jgi:acyl-CoA synthetase (AMP-forming)/AMP-acid ligase II